MSDNNSKLPEGIYKKTHVYQAVDYDNPKHLFTVIGDKIEALVINSVPVNLLDIGGASGAFCYYINKRFIDFKTVCLEYDEKLCEVGKERVPESTFICGDVNKRAMIEDNSFDVVTMLGVMTIFDDFQPSLSECLRVAKPGSNVFVLGQFNDHDIDVLIRYRYSNNGVWNRGWNIFSKCSVDAFLSARTDIEKWSYEKFTLPFDLEKQDDPIRSWTEINANDQRIFKNGLNLEINLQILHIILKGED